MIPVIFPNDLTSCSIDTCSSMFMSLFTIDRNRKNLNIHQWIHSKKELYSPVKKKEIKKFIGK